jgi:hypothetical protein
LAYYSFKIFITKISIFLNTMSKIFLLIFLLIYSLSGISQGIKGTIKNEKGEPVEYASIYIKELSKGTISGINGDFEISLLPGSYTVFFHSLGFNTEKREVFVAQSFLDLDITLITRHYEIKEVVVKNKSEDPAYPIMRKAIALAQYHLNQISHYKANLYLKGAATVVKMPKLLSNHTNMNVNGQTIKIKNGDVFVMESFKRTNIRCSRQISPDSNFEPIFYS